MWDLEETDMGKSIRNSLLLMHSSPLGHYPVPRSGIRKCCLEKRQKPIRFHEFLQLLCENSLLSHPPMPASSKNFLPLCREAVSFFSVLNQSPWLQCCRI